MNFHHKKKLKTLILIFAMQATLGAISVAHSNDEEPLENVYGNKIKIKPTELNGKNHKVTNPNSNTAVKPAKSRVKYKKLKSPNKETSRYKTKREKIGAKAKREVGGSGISKRVINAPDSWIDNRGSSSGPVIIAKRSIINK